MRPRNGIESTCVRIGIGIVLALRSIDEPRPLSNGLSESNRIGARARRDARVGGPRIAHADWLSLPAARLWSASAAVAASLAVFAHWLPSAFRVERSRCRCRCRCPRCAALRYRRFSAFRLITIVLLFFPLCSLPVRRYDSDCSASTVHLAAAVK